MAAQLDLSREINQAVRAVSALPPAHGPNGSRPSQGSVDKAVSAAGRVRSLEQKVVPSNSSPSSKRGSAPPSSRSGGLAGSLVKGALDFALPTLATALTGPMGGIAVGAFLTAQSFAPPKDPRVKASPSSYGYQGGAVDPSSYTSFADQAVPLSSPRRSGVAEPPPRNPIVVGPSVSAKVTDPNGDKQKRRLEQASRDVKHRVGSFAALSDRPTLDFSAQDMGKLSPQNKWDVALNQGWKGTAPQAGLDVGGAKSALYALTGPRHGSGLMGLGL